MPIQSIVVSKDFTFRVNIVIRPEPLTGKFSYTLWDNVTNKKLATQTQFQTYDDAAKSAAVAVKELLIGSANEAEAKILQQLEELALKL
jgi:hypothetical protein